MSCPRDVEPALLTSAKSPAPNTLRQQIVITTQSKIRAMLASTREGWYQPISAFVVPHPDLQELSLLRI
jgi:hypothetical protein